MLNFCAAQDLTEHRWRHRVILLFAPGADHPVLEKQLALLTEHSGEVTDRDLVFYTISPTDGYKPDGEPLSTEARRSFQQHYKVSTDQFCFILIGKDGTEKLRRQTVVPLSELFALIDSMPMRQAEMNRKGK